MASVTPARMKRLRAVHARAREIGLDADDRRALQERVTGKASCSDMDEQELARVLGAMKNGTGNSHRVASSRDRLAQGPHTAKIRALWLSAWHLGVTRSRSDAAIIAFVKRQTGLDAAAWAGAPGDSAKAVEGLKAWLAREAGVDWGPYETRTGPVDRPRARVLEAQWRILHRLGLVASADTAAIGGYARARLKLDHAVPHTALIDIQADIVIRHFGERIRAAHKTAEATEKKQ